MAQYVRNICADGEECQPLPGTYKAPECYMIRSVNEFEDPIPIAHKWGYLSIACITIGLGAIESGLGGQLYNITRYTATDNPQFNTLLVGDGYIRGIGSWWASMVCVIAGGIAIAAVVQPKSQKAFVLAACIASGIGMALMFVGVALESYVYAVGTKISACVSLYDSAAEYRYFGYNGDYTNAVACLTTYGAATGSTNACFCVNKGGNGAKGYCSKITQASNSPYTPSQCNTPMNYNDYQLSSICLGAITWGITVCLFIYSIVLLVEQPPLSIAEMGKPNMQLAVNSPFPAVEQPAGVPTLKI